MTNEVQQAREALGYRLGDIRKDARVSGRQLAALEEKVEKLAALLGRVDAALAAPDAFSRNALEAARLSAQREELARTLARAEEEWLELAALQEG